MKKKIFSFILLAASLNLAKTKKNLVKETITSINQEPADAVYNTETDTYTVKGIPVPREIFEYHRLTMIEVATFIDTFINDYACEEYSKNKKESNRLKKKILEARPDNIYNIFTDPKIFKEEFIDILKKVYPDQKEFTTIYYGRLSIEYLIFKLSDTGADQPFPHSHFEQDSCFFRIILTYLLNYIELKEKLLLSTSVVILKDFVLFKKFLTEYIGPIDPKTGKPSSAPFGLALLSGFLRKLKNFAHILNTLTQTKGSIEGKVSLFTLTARMRRIADNNKIR
jgi:hypothetical protein